MPPIKDIAKLAADIYMDHREPLLEHVAAQLRALYVDLLWRASEEAVTKSLDLDEWEFQVTSTTFDDPEWPSQYRLIGSWQRRSSS